MADSGFFSFLDYITYVDDDSSKYEISVNDTGFSYLDMMSEKKARITFAEKQQRKTSAALDGSTRARGKLNIKKHEVIDHDAVCLDTDLMAILRDIEARRKKTPYFPFAAVIVGIVLLLWLMIPALLFEGGVRVMAYVVFIWIPPVALVALWNVWKLDISRKHVKCTYRLEGQGAVAFQSINHALGSLANSAQVLLFQGRRHFEDTRYTGGAGTLPELTGVRIDRARPPLIELDFDVWHLRAFHKDLFFMPDHLLVFDGAHAGGINYAQLRFGANKEVTQARDRASVTPDCKVVGHTYRFVNNDGSPDKRFNNNVQIAMIEYGIFSVAGSGLELHFYASRQDSATSAPAGFSSMQHLASLPVRRVADDRHQEQTSTQINPLPQADFFDVLLDAVCCVMVSDGRASRAEKEQIASLFQGIQAPWDAGQIQQRVSSFIERIQREGFGRVMDSTCHDLTHFAHSQQHRDIVMQSISSVLHADGQIEAGERKVYARFRQALGEA